jgi:hypothetical protein
MLFPTMKILFVLLALIAPAWAVDVPANKYQPPTVKAVTAFVDKWVRTAGVRFACSDKPIRFDLYVEPNGKGERKLISPPWHVHIYAPKDCTFAQPKELVQALCDALLLEFDTHSWETQFFVQTTCGNKRYTAELNPPVGISAWDRRGVWDRIPPSEVRED